MNEEKRIGRCGQRVHLIGWGRTMVEGAGKLRVYSLVGTVVFCALTLSGMGRCWRQWHDLTYIFKGFLWLLCGE